MRRLPRIFVVFLVTLSAQAQQGSPAGEFAVLRTDRVTVTTGETTRLNCSVVGTGDAAQINCESQSGSGIPLVYHVALVVGSNHVGYVVSCGGGLVRRIGCQPLSAGQVLKGYIEGDKLHVPVGNKTKSYRIETSAYIGPLTKGESTSPTLPSAPSTAPEPSVKLAVHTQTAGDSSSDVAKPDQPSFPASNAKVMVSSEPTGGDIYVDGNFMGNTPSLIELPAGSHAIRVEAKDQKTWSRTVRLTSGSKVTLQAVLDPAH
jgi:PEGA domain